MVVKRRATRRQIGGNPLVSAAASALIGPIVKTGVEWIIKKVKGGAIRRLRRRRA